MTTKTSLACAAFALLAACSPYQPPQRPFVALHADAGGDADGSTSGGDDAGSATADAGDVRDAGQPGTDAGNPAPDAGTAADAGNPVADAGNPATDAGADAGPAGDAGGGDGGDPYNTPPQCSSNTYWTQGDHGSAQMHPGDACDRCHKLGGSATKYPFDVSGTVYPTAHEPIDCNGTNAASVVITDSAGKDHTLTVNAAGNFYNYDYLGFGAIPTPYTAKVVGNGKTRAMIASQTNGDCNACHTDTGAQGAPGRIILP